MTLKTTWMLTATRCMVLGTLAWCAVAPAYAGGTAENLLLIIDPTDPDALYVGNHYRCARQLPDTNVLYLAPGATDYAEFASYNLPALFGQLANNGLDDHIDYILVAPTDTFHVSAPGYVSWECAQVSRFSIGSAYGLAFLSRDIIRGEYAFNSPNHYYRISVNQAFDSATAWLYGQPSSSASAERYFIGASLGYTGANGNSVDELIDMIDRSVAADGTRPAGTFYFMNNTGDSARNVRATQYAGAKSLIEQLGGTAEIISGVLPAGCHDCLGIMTGAATLALGTTDLTILPGAFGDHLTSWAATFDNSSQTKVSAWITHGASGSWGTVEEPCNYTGKFPYARLHWLYLDGASLGEVALRTVGYLPFQGLIYGDPLTRPFAYLPVVTVADAPTGPVSGTITLTPDATTSHPTGAIAGFKLLIDGVLHSAASPGELFSVDTTRLADGCHDLRVLAFDDTSAGSTGRWLGTLDVDNQGRSVTLGASVTAGNLSTLFVFDLSAAGGEVSEIRLMQNGRVVAAVPGGTVAVYGHTFGAGPVAVHAEALFANDRRPVRSATVTLDVAPTADAPDGAPPVAFSFTRYVDNDGEFLIELPTTFDGAAADLTWELVQEPTSATVVPGSTGPYCLMNPRGDAQGQDTFQFQVSAAAGTSNIAEVTLIYRSMLGDMNCDGVLNFDDIDPFVVALVDEGGLLRRLPGLQLEQRRHGRQRRHQLRRHQPVY